jgi:hypothetical protein
MLCSSSAIPLKTALLLVMLGCGDKDTAATDSGDTASATEGTLALTFRIDSDYQAQMDEAATGTFYGAYWLADEVTSLGPEEGAVSLGSIEVDLDLTVDNPGAVLLTSPALPAVEVVILGFLDSDANADPSDPSPDTKDPVTLPTQNDFDVVGGEETTVEVFFGFLNP